MRVVQLIDSLDAGGAESMAVNYANVLAQEIAFSGLVVTRHEGVLLSKLSHTVNYLFLKRNKILDIRAILNFKRYLKQNKITVVHAHGSSYFFATLVKLLYPKVKLVWHDHLGDRRNVKGSGFWLLKIASLFFSGVIACNIELLTWAKNNLYGSKKIFVPNFTSLKQFHQNEIELKGEQGKRIICLSNLKKPKNHLGLLKGFYRSALFQDGWTLHLVGKDFNDIYSKEIKEYIKAQELLDSVYVYGLQEDVAPILKQSDIGVLSSTYEGFPVVLLEYGLSGLAVISTNVGYCPEIINLDNGLLYAPKDELELAEKLKMLASSPEMRFKFANNLNDFVKRNYSQERIIKKVINFYKEI